MAGKRFGFTPSASRSGRPRGPRCLIRDPKGDAVSHDMNELASIELVVTTEDLDKAIALLLTFRWEALYQDVLHAFILERDRRKLGSPARAIVLARQRVDELPPDVKAALISRHEFSHVRRSPSTRPMNEPRPTSFTILVIVDDPGLLEVATELLSGKGIGSSSPRAAKTRWP